MKNEILQGEAAPPLAEGRYRLLSVLGVGGMATVYRGYDARLQVYRAVKVLSPALAKRKSLKSRFEAEASTMALLQHRNIVAVHDIGADGNRIFIVMEMVEGGSLLDRVREYGPLPPRMALDVTIKMLDALKVAHKRGVVHRDIKPHNILITPEGDIRITDFGIAQMRKWEDDNDGLTKTGAVMGTWGFMAPEQRQDAKSVDHRADLYSVGATLYSVLTDKTPVDLFAADMDASMMADISPVIADLIKTATRYNREERYADAVVMAEVCRQAMDLIGQDPPETAPLALPPKHDNSVRLDPRAFASGANSSVGASSPPMPSAVPDSSPFGDDLLGSPSLPPPPLRAFTTGNSASGLGQQVVPAWRAPREAITGETAVPEEGGTDISDYLEPAESDEVGRITTPLDMLPESALRQDPSVYTGGTIAPINSMPVPIPTPPVVVQAPPDKRIEKLVTITAVLAGVTLLAVLLLVIARPWEVRERPGDGTPTNVGAQVPVQPQNPTPDNGVKDKAPTPPVETPGVETPSVQNPPVETPVVQNPPTQVATNSTGSNNSGSNSSGSQGSTQKTGTGSRTDPKSGTGSTDTIKVTPPDPGPTTTAEPSISHKVPGSATLGKPLTLTATLPSDNFDVILRYRAKGGSSYSELRMMGSGGRFSASFPVDEAYVAGVEYFIKAVPIGGGKALESGSGFKPNAVPARRE